MARALSSRCASRPLPFFDNEGRQQCDLLTADKPRKCGRPIGLAPPNEIANTEAPGPLTMTRSRGGARPNCATPARATSASVRTRSGPEFRSSLSALSRRASKPAAAAPCVARQPACVRTKCQWPRAAVTSTSRTSSTGIVISPFGTKASSPGPPRPPVNASAARKTGSAERGSCPGQPIHRRHHHIALPANAISPGISSTVTRKMPRICSPVSETVGRTSTGV